MDLSFGPEYDAYRETVRAFVARHAGDAPRTMQAGRIGPANLAWQRLLIENGYVARTIPREYGGAGEGSDLLKTRIIDEEFAAARMPGGLFNVGAAFLVPMLLELGTGEQKQRWIRPTIHGETLWCEGFSEPDAGSDLASLPNSLDSSGINRFFSWRLRKTRFDGLSPRKRWRRLFDPSVTRLSDLPIGFFEQKALILPRSCLPSSEAELARFCRQLIDRGEDKDHINVMLKSWPVDWSLETHAAALWELRNHDKQFYECVVRGRHGRALRLLSGKDEVGGISVGKAKWLLGRQALLWCAMDVQMTTSRARVSFTKPLGSFLSSTMAVMKPGTVLRLMLQGINFLEMNLPNFQTADAELQNGNNDAKIKGKIPRLLAFRAEKQIRANSKTVDDYQRELDDSVPEIRETIPELRELFEYLLNYMTKDIPPLVRRDGTVEKRTNRLRHFHPMWFSDLSATVGMAVAQVRYAMAELHIEAMIEKAASAPTSDRVHFKQVEPLPALPEDEEALASIVERVLDLSDSARRAQLDDVDWKSRLKRSLGNIRSARELQKVEPSVVVRDPSDKAGLTFINDAIGFLQDMGQREPELFKQRNPFDHRHLTYWHMDVVPEERLAL